MAVHIIKGKVEHFLTELDLRMASCLGSLENIVLGARQGPQCMSEHM